MSTTYVVRCDDYTSSPSKTREAAERHLEHIEHAGYCTLPHTVEEVAEDAQR